MQSFTVLFRVSENINAKSLVDHLLPDRNINFQRLYDINEHVENYRRQNPLVSTEISNNEELFDTKILSRLPEEEANLYRTYHIDDCIEDFAQNLVTLLNESDQVEFAEVDREQSLHAAPDDPDFQQQWGLQKIQVEEVWLQTTGQNVIVAVVDSGVDYNHPDLKDNMWTHANGHHGFDFSNNTTNPMDKNGHGTYVAGIIGAVTNNGKQIAGVAYRAKIMAVKIYGSAQTTTSAIGAKGIKYAVDNGAKVINNSWGPTKKGPIMGVVNDVIVYAYSRGAIVVFSAGNSNDDVKNYGQANHPLVIVVGGTNEDDSRLLNSNFGQNVTIAAPGDRILSLKPNSDTPGNGWGTSASAPFVSGVIALLKKLNPKTTTFDTVKALLKRSGDVITTDKPIGKRLNAKKAAVKDPENLLRVEQQVPFSYSGVTGCAGREPAETKKQISKWINVIKTKYPDYNVLSYGKLWSAASTKTKKEGFPSNKRSCKTTVNMRCYALLELK